MITGSGSFDVSQPSISGGGGYTCQPQTVVVTVEVVVTATPETVMAKTFNQMVTEAMAEVPAISPEEAYRRMQEDPRTLVIDPRDAAEIPLTTGIIPGAMNISYGRLTYAADNEVPQEWREPELADRSRPIITACESGDLGALAGKLLKDMGFTNVSILEGGTQAWKDAGYPTEYISPELTVQKQLPAGEADETWNHVKRDE